jgi:hypothetical protein
MACVSSPVLTVSESKAVALTGSRPICDRPLARTAVSAATRCAMRVSPSGPWYTAYMLATTAGSTCAVQMLEVAFSRRMCCSRVCSARR